MRAENDASHAGTYWFGEPDDKVCLPFGSRVRQNAMQKTGKCLFPKCKGDLILRQYLRPNSDDVAAKIVDGEAILINLSNGMYYSMDSVGAFVWSLIEAGRSQDSIAEVVAGQYGIAKETAIQDIAALIEELTKENLIVLVTGDSAAEYQEIDDISASEAYTAPQVTKFDDMAELFAFDPPLARVSNLKKLGDTDDDTGIA